MNCHILACRGRTEMVGSSNLIRCSWQIHWAEVHRAPVPMLQKTSKFFMRGGDSPLKQNRGSGLRHIRVACATSTTMLYRRFVVSRTIYAVTHYICSVTQDSTVRRYVSQSPWNVECVNIACWRYGILLTKAADTMREYFALLYKQDN